MKIEKLTDNKIRIILDIDEKKKKNITDGLKDSFKKNDWYCK